MLSNAAFDHPFLNNTFNFVAKWLDILTAIGLLSLCLIHQISNIIRGRSIQDRNKHLPITNKGNRQVHNPTLFFEMFLSLFDDWNFVDFSRKM